MSNLHTIIDFGSNTLRLGVFNQSLEIIYSSNVKNAEVHENEIEEEPLIKLIRDAEKQLSSHLIDVNVLIDSPKYNFIDFSIKKSFDQPTPIKSQYESLLEEAKFIISENNFKEQVIHFTVSNMIVDDKKNLESISDDIKIRSLILEIKFICLRKSLIDYILNKFKKNNLNIINIYCSSYVKSIYFKKNLKLKNNNFIFLDIGFERTTANFFYKNKLEFLNSIHVGSNSITKDISKILKLDVDYSEELKKEYSKVESDISSSKNSSNNVNLYSKTIKKNISTNLIKKIIEARVDEIIELSVINSNYFKKKFSQENTDLVLIGGGSKLLSNIFTLNSKKFFSELIYIKESDIKILNAGMQYHKSEQRFHLKHQKKYKKSGFFENFFNLFSK